MILFYHSVLLSSLFVFAWAQEDCRRPPPGWPQRPPRCCDIPFPTEEMKKEFGTCIKSSHRPPVPDAMSDPQLCVDQCVYNRIGLLKGEGKELDENSVTKKLTSSVSQQWSSAMDTSIKACFTETKDIKVDNTGQCHVTANAYTHCLLRQLFLNCPKELWNDSNECNLVKKRMEVCPGLPPPPPPIPQHPALSMHPDP